MLVLMLGGVKCAANSPSAGEAVPPSPQDMGDLLLTPYIKKEEIDEARNKSRVSLFEKFGVEAYSGFITVNQRTNSNLFFLFVVAEDNRTEAPLLLWTQGGPGLSALFGQFLQNGPVAFNHTQNNSGLPLAKRNNTLQKNMSIIYLDLPVGAGFSFTDNKSAYLTTLEEISDSAIEFLEQFLKLFPRYVCRDFFVAGESYAARYSVAIADKLLRNPSKILLKLKGTIGGNGFLGPILETADSSDFLYWTSMLNESGCREFSARFDYMRNLSKTHDRYMVAGLLMQTLLVDPYKINKTLFQILTSYNDHASPLYTERPYNMMACFFFLYNITNTIVRETFHVNLSRTFEYLNLPFLKALAPDYLEDISDMIQRVLNASDVLFYTGQLDALFPSVNQRRYYARLNWTYSLEYRETERIPWRPHTWNNDMGYAGFLKRVPGFTDAMLLGMSHYGAAEKPDEVYFLMMEFMFNWTRNGSLLSHSSGTQNTV